MIQKADRSAALISFIPLVLAFVLYWIIKQMGNTPTAELAAVIFFMLLGLAPLISAYFAIFKKIYLITLLEILGLENSKPAIFMFIAFEIIGGLFLIGFGITRFIINVGN